MYNMFKIHFFFSFRITVSSETQPDTASFQDEVSFFPVACAFILWSVGHPSPSRVEMTIDLASYITLPRHQTQRLLCCCVGGYGPFWFLLSRGQAM